MLGLNHNALIQFYLAVSMSEKHCWTCTCFTWRWQEEEDITRYILHYPVGLCYFRMLFCLYWSFFVHV